MIFPFVYLAASHVLLVYITYRGGRLLGFDRQDQISIMYTAPQKTLAMGAPLLTMYFSNNPEILGIVLLPIIFYHSWELLFGGIIKSVRLFALRVK